MGCAAQTCSRVSGAIDGQDGLDLEALQRGLNMGGHEMALAIRGMGGMCNKVCSRTPGEEVGLCPIGPGSADKVTTKFTYIGTGNGQYEVLEMRGGAAAGDGDGEAPAGVCGKICPCCRGKGRLRREIVVLTFVLVTVIALLLAVSISASGSGAPSTNEGAAPGPRLDFKCDKSATWQSEWSDAKKDWCCRRFPPLGCPSNQDIWAQASRPTPGGGGVANGNVMPVGGNGPAFVGGGAQPAAGGPVPKPYQPQAHGASVLADA